MIVDIGGGTTEVAVISLGGIVVSQSLRVGGDEMDEAIINHIKSEYKLLIGQQTAEEIKLEVGSACELQRGGAGRGARPRHAHRPAEDGRPHAPRRCATRSRSPVSQIIDAIKSTLDKTPPELAADIMDRGIVLAGGGALLHGLDERLRHETQMPVHLAESPLTCVAVGSGRSLEEFEAIHRASASARSRRPTATAANGTGQSRPPSLAYTRPFRASQPDSARVGGAGLSVQRPAVHASRLRASAVVRRRLVVVCSCSSRSRSITVSFRESAAARCTARRASAHASLRPFEVAAERVARPFRDAYELVRRARRREVREREAEEEVDAAAPAGDRRTQAAAQRERRS